MCHFFEEKNQTTAVFKVKEGGLPTWAALLGTFDAGGYMPSRPFQSLWRQSFANPIPNEDLGLETSQ